MSVKAGQAQADVPEIRSGLGPVSRVEGFAGFLDPEERGFDPGDRPAEDELRKDVFALRWCVHHRVEPAPPGLEEPAVGIELDLRRARGNQVAEEQLERED